MEHNPWMTCVGMAAMMNGLVAGGPPIGPGGIFSLSDPDELERVAKDAGFVDVAVEAFDVPFVSDSVDAHIERVGSLAGPLGEALNAATADQLAAVRHSASELAAPYVTDDGVCHARPGASGHRSRLNESRPSFIQRLASLLERDATLFLSSERLLHITLGTT